MRVYPNYDKMPKDFGYVKEYRKIKIYSTFNNELLAQYDVDEAKLIEAQEKYKKREISFKEFAGIVNSGYKFNENPSTPQGNFENLAISLNHEMPNIYLQFF